MATNDFSAEAASNYEQKCLCVLVLDISGSMRGKPIEALNEGLKNFYEDICNDDTKSQRIEISIITFNENVNTVQEPALVENFTMPVFSANGTTAMVDAVNAAIDKVAARKEWYKSQGIPYYRPWIILMTDGEPDEFQDVAGLSARIKEDTASKRYQFIPIAVDGANMDIMNQIAGTIPPMKLREARFSEFFQWLSNSIGTVVNAHEGDTVTLDDPSGWMQNFEVG